MRLIIATKNRDKVREIKEMLDGMSVEVKSLIDFEGVDLPEEDGDTFSENARIKARHVAGNFPNDWVLADDSGLVVDALKGAPGVKSARYGGIKGDYRRNNERLLKDMREIPKGRRGASFVCVMVLMGPGGLCEEVEGRCLGEIAFEPRGKGGFGYDPLFFIPEKGRTMAELAAGEKNAISHRGRALTELKRVLLEILTKRK